LSVVSVPLLDVSYDVAEDMCVSHDGTAYDVVLHAHENVGEIAPPQDCQTLLVLIELRERVDPVGESSVPPLVFVLGEATLSNPIADRRNETEKVMWLHLGESVDAVLEICMLALDLDFGDVVFVVIDEVAKF